MTVLRETELQAAGRALPLLANHLAAILAGNGDLPEAQRIMGAIANALACTWKPDSPGMVQMQRAEAAIRAGNRETLADIAARASSADHLRREVAARDETIARLESRIRILEAGEVYSSNEIRRLNEVMEARQREELRGLEDKALWAKPAAAVAA